jgi:dephospho-CoA kinase
MIIGVLGEKLAGKDTVAEYLVDKYGASHVRTSKILDELLNVLGLPITRQNEIEAGRGMEIVFGPHVIGEAVKKRIENLQKKDLIIINGLRLQNQFDDAKQLGAKIIYVTAPAELRYQRSLKRIKENKDGISSFEDFLAVEQGWTEITIPKFATRADYKIENTGTLEELHAKVDMIIHTLKEQEPSN